MSKKLKLTFFWITIVGVLVVSLLLMIQMNRITNDNKFFSSLMGNMNENIINQSIFVFILNIYGLLLMMCFNRFMRRDMIIVLNLIVGALAFATISNLIICFDLKKGITEFSR